MIQHELQFHLTGADLHRLSGPTQVEIRKAVIPETWKFHTSMSIYFDFRSSGGAMEQGVIYVGLDKASVA